MTVFADVPLTGPDWSDWGPRCKERAATVAVTSSDGGVVRPFDEDAFTAALSGEAVVRPIIPWGGAGRYALGWLVAYKAYA